MNLLVLFLALLTVLAVAAGILLLMRLRRKEAQLKAVLGEPVRPDQPGASSYEMTAIDQMLYDRCCRYMTQHRPFLVDSFSLQDLANAIYTNKGSLSKTINRFSGRNFRGYVNYYRVMYAMELFRKDMTLRVSDLSDLSGFHSVTSFFQSFKSVMGEPPSHWWSRVREKHIKSLKT